MLLGRTVSKGPNTVIYTVNSVYYIILFHLILPILNQKILGAHTTALVDQKGFQIYWVVWL